MAASIGKIFGYCQSLTLSINSLAACKILKISRRAFSLSKTLLTISLPISFAAALAASSSFTYSLACLNTAALCALYLPSLIKTCARQLILRHPAGLEFACKWEWIELVEERLANRDITSPISPDGSSLLHYAALLGLPKLAEFLLKQGIPVDLLDRQERSALHAAVAKRQTKIVEILLNANADASLPCKTSNRVWTPVMIAHHKGFNEILEMLIRYAKAEEIREILGLNGVQVFDHCQNIHDFCEVFWPASRERLPSHWKEIVAKLPKEISLETLALEKTNLVKGIQLLKDLPEGIQDISKLLEVLKKANPLFARMYELAGSPTVVIDDTLKSPGKYNSLTHTIFLKTLPLEEMVEYLIFETANALQRASFQAIYAKRASMPREAYTISNEWQEARSCYWRIQAFVPMIGGKASPLESRFTENMEQNFELLWPYLNQNQQFEGTYSHADSHRRSSDQAISFQRLLEAAAAYKERSLPKAQVH